MIVHRHKKARPARAGRPQTSNYISFTPKSFRAKRHKITKSEDMRLTFLTLIRANMRETGDISLNFLLPAATPHLRHRTAYANPHAETATPSQPLGRPADRNA